MDGHIIILAIMIVKGGVNGNGGYDDRYKDNEN